MYLKSLVLKGFKSFADRTVLTLKPGITAVVGPNGSGKSNISDAVLWVLGERNAKNLRGAAMEDVIFAGTPLRKPAAVAEVDLVLDNTDGTLPLDYDEVVVTRRAYRSESGSEYLINGTPARRIDVLNILHDSGLGTGTHSIISQGALDSILQSKPEDRRALIEEAAGVLKHKQRKERSARKLQAMEQHVERVRDVVAEVGRQLGPLERKAKRALKHQELSAELAEATLALAVDDLRSLQRSWEDVKGRQGALDEQERKAREAVERDEALAEEVQERIGAVRVDSDEMARQQQAAAKVAERLGAAAMLARERRESALARVSEIDAADAAAHGEIAQAEADVTQAQADLQEVRGAHEAAKASVEALAKASEEALGRRAAMEAELAEQQAANRAALARAEELRVQRDRAREALSQGIAQVQLLEARIGELEAQAAQAQEEAVAAKGASAEAEGAHKALQESEAACRTELGERFQEREAARRALDEARAAERALAAQVDAYERMEKAAAQEAGSAHEWLLAHADDLQGAIAPLTSCLRVQEGYEGIVESLLGADVAALLVDDAQAAEDAADALSSQGEQGAVTLLLRRDRGRAPLEGAPAAGDVLMDKVSCPEEARAAVAELLGDVLVVDTLEEALRCHGQGAEGWRIAARDGSVVWPGGKVTLGAALMDQQEGALHRARRLEELRAQLADAQQKSEEAQGASEAADAAWREAQSRSADLTQELAKAKGAAEGAAARATRSQEALDTLRASLEAARSEHERTQGSLQEAQPDADTMERDIAAQQEAAATAQARIDELDGQLGEARAQAQGASEQLRAAQVELAQLAERDAYLEAMRRTRQQALDQARAALGSSRREREAKRASADRLSSLQELAEAILARARAFSASVDDHVRRSQASTAGLYDQLREAQERRRRDQGALNELQERRNAITAERERISMQVDAAQRAIVEDCATPLETALALPPLEGRAEVEDAAAALARRIANLGTINPDAAAEYEELKARYDFLTQQLDDLGGARRSLSRIDRIIDERMRNDFLRTFEEVDANFREIFASLFPGGQAHLSLVDPEDPENSGVEVNAQPAGKRIAKMSLMSGGEKSLTALALLFAVYATRATPFYILDEVEAALDDTNLRRLVAFVEQLRGSTQLIMITHQRRTMETADVLFGLSMQGDGITTVLSQTLNQALRYAE